MSFNESKIMFSKLDSSMDLSEHFFRFVFNKISRKKLNRFVEKDHYSIDIIPFDSEPIKVIPIFKDMDKDNLFLHEEIELACRLIQNDKIKCIYFVYPKNVKFTKHIEIKVPILESTCSEYVIKIIPYSLNDLYKKGINNGNCNILCK
ncbi:MAG: hypothetical protein CSA86_01495 [Arcobacter sp.]|nr:MAG: hypothetical protein CSA86_01495 [Arcobacter sp.]